MTLSATAAAASQAAGIGGAIVSCAAALDRACASAAATQVLSLYIETTFLGPLTVAFPAGSSWVSGYAADAIVETAGRVLGGIF